MKICSICNKEKHDIDFCKEKRTNDGLESRCKDCKNKKRSERRSTLIGYIRNAVCRKDRSKLNYVDVLKLYHKQKGRCALSGIKMTHQYGEGLVPTNISIDRINKGIDGGEYTIDNIRLLCVHVNMALNMWTDKEFIEMCQQIINNNRRNNESIK